MYTNLHVYKSTCIQIYMYTNLHVYKSTCIHVYVGNGIILKTALNQRSWRIIKSIFVYVYANLHVYKSTCIQIYMYTNIHVYTYTNLHVYIGFYEHNLKKKLLLSVFFYENIGL